MRLTFEEIQSEIKRVFIKYGLSEEKADICARIHTESTYDGIYSHGTNRVARFVDYIKKGWVDVNADPTLEKDCGAIKVYNGNMGPGILNALFACDRAMEMADQYGIGMIGLKNTTHWMRGGTYGLYAARKGYVAIMWTNTEACMPPWGAKECRLGNNPFVMALPGNDNQPVLQLDMAISQYAYGKLQVTRLAGKKLPFPGGFDNDGNLTDDPGAIEESMRILPIGYWKGSSFSFMLDVLGAVLTDGVGAADLDAATKGSCGGCSQVMILIDPKKITDGDSMTNTITRAIEYLKSAELAENSKGIMAPGEDYIQFNKDHDENGIFVDDGVWEEIKSL
ncbi:3-dehydro-L-gulonate 2-dehydrogenase [Candidatus Galacturonibacter soehngenii]|uniref:3-dehydro-L-gulonate 2-dehydrogenase n=1 Tax=Candidatus Galacturonatibacter soehngenii TaxID=2307010 RepID=A0A7V7QJ78_9FIRM|nr:3-dehydro-L-gulonate 2-dehydrogenase [Candidatus Galacturonibacter soehngenii]KAB1436066.1 3-dehydro-L-gulonate 2-dehydrogenase [Candidatus Galacturonibacter soehngenii]MBA4686195.1 3-dehydro-L-gulonate 2-dehydrogenase [Candidatus Galacturonibacter soehngenii]